MNELVRRSPATAAAVAMAIATTACGVPFQPQPMQGEAVEARAQSARDGAFRVSAAVPSPEETAVIFGVPLYKRGVQPVWLQVENTGTERARFAPVSVDRDYFSPLEVAYVHRGGFDKRGKQDIETFFHGIAMPRWIPAGETRSGYVFTHSEPGTKGFNVEIFGSETHRTFTFFVEVPGFEPDHADVDFDALYTQGEVRSYDLDGLRSALGDLECCTVDEAGDEPGERINVVIVGEGLQVLQALLRARWYETEKDNVPSWMVTRPHWRGRPPDAVFRRSRKKRGERNELRLWLAPMRLGEAEIWVGQVTHHPPSLLGWTFLDPDIDEARDYFFQDLLYSQAVAATAWLDAGDPVSFENRGKGHGLGAEYFTDGHRAVLWLSGPPVRLEDVRRVNWDDPPFRR